MSVKFSYSSTDYSFKNPEKTNAHELRKPIAFGMSAGGVTYNYPKGITKQKFRLRWENFCALEKAQFATMFNAIYANDFTYTDEQKTVWNARFLLDTLDFVNILDQKDQDDPYIIGSTNYPSTTRKEDMWEVALELEVWA